MKYNDLRRCMNLAELMCTAVGVDVAEGNAEIFDEPNLISILFECAGAQVEILLAPKGED